MLALQCGKCGSTKLTPNKYAFCYKCSECGQESNLYEAKFVYIKDECPCAEALPVLVVQEQMCSA